MKCFVYLTAFMASCIIFSTAFCAEKVVVIPLNSKAQIEKQSFTLSLPPSSFVPSSATDRSIIRILNGDLAFIYDSTLSGKMAAPVNLPEGAELNYLECFLYDNAPANFISTGSSITLWRRDITSVSEENMLSATFNTTGTSTNMKAIGTSAISFPIIANSKYMYGMHITMQLSAADLTGLVRFYGCQLSYDLDVVLP